MAVKPKELLKISEEISKDYRYLEYVFRGEVFKECNNILEESKRRTVDFDSKPKPGEHR